MSKSNQTSHYSLFYGIFKWYLKKKNLFWDVFILQFISSAVTGIFKQLIAVKSCKELKAVCS
jgi:hypothetical protein